MAETKRQSIAGKVPVATPNIGPSGMPPLETALAAAIGAKVRLLTITPNSRTLEGTIFTVSPTLNLLTITTSPTPTAHPSTWHFLPISAIHSFQTITLSPAPQASLPQVDNAAAQARLDATVDRLKAEDARKGKGVSKEAQEIFDKLSRTLPTRWDGKNIVATDSVVIEAPYRPEDCKLLGGAPKESLGRVRKVLTEERKKMGEKAGAKPAVPAAIPLSGPRKGG